MSKWLELTVLSAIVWLGASGTAHAYVDPGSGSVIITTILGLLAAIGYTLRKQFYRISSRFTRLFTKAKSDGDKAE